MPDGQAWIKIGGTIATKETLGRVAKAIVDAGLGSDMHSGIDYLDDEEALKALEEAARKGEPFYGANGCTPHGFFRDLEAMLTGMGLCWLRHNSSSYDWPACYEAYHVGDTAPRTIPSDDDGCALMQVDDVATLLKESKESDDLVRELTDLVSKHTIADPPPLKILSLKPTEEEDAIMLVATKLGTPMTIPEAHRFLEEHGDKIDRTVNRTVAEAKGAAIEQVLLAVTHEENDT